MLKQILNILNPNRKVRVVFHIDSITAEYLQDFNEDGKSINLLNGKEILECYYNLENRPVIIEDKWMRYKDIDTVQRELSETYYMETESISYFIVSK